MELLSIRDMMIFNSGTAAIEKTLSVETGTGKLEGTLLTMGLNMLKTVALIIAGSGPTDRNGNNSTMINNSLKMLADELAKIGISSLRYDKRCRWKYRCRVKRR